MKVVQINTFNYKATGSIMMNLHNSMQNNGIESYVVWGRGKKSNSKYEISMEDYIGVRIHGFFTRVFDLTGFLSIRATKKLIQQLKKIKPDIVHLHNLHGYYLNINLLFNYLKKEQIKVIWTLHDCWAFTGHCAYFEMIKCQKWKTGCYKCKQKNTYPSSEIFDNSKWNYKKKKELFSNLNITIVTPSNWLANLVKESFMSNYSTKVINNGIDLSIFKPVKSNFKKENKIENKTIILGVASEWTERKGLKDFIRLSEILPEKYKIVLIGLTAEQAKKVPESIIKIQRTNNVQELVEIYSAADVFFNPTYEDNYPTTNIEALSCGVPVYTYPAGGSSECLIDNRCGDIIPYGDFNTLITKLDRCKSKKETLKINSSKIRCELSKEKMINSYIDLYRSIGD